MFLIFSQNRGSIVLNLFLNLTKSLKKKKEKTKRVTHLDHDPEVVGDGLGVLLPGDGDGQVPRADDARHHDAVALLARREAEGVDHRRFCKIMVMI